MSELWRWPKVNLGFVSKGIEVADQLLREGDRDPSARGQKMRQSGLMIINSFIRLVPMTPPAGSPNTTVGNTSFGWITSQFNNPRLLQISGRFSF